MELRRVKRDFVHDKREEERAYREARYDDENWARQWYLVGHLIVTICLKRSLHRVYFSGIIANQSAKLRCRGTARRHKMR